MSDISPSSIKTTKTLEEQINAAQSQIEVQEILRQAAIDQKLVHRDWDPNILTPNEPGTVPRGFAKAVTDGQGRKLIFEGATELEVEQRLGEYFRSLNLAHPEPQTPESARGADGRFVEQGKQDDRSALEAANQVELELRWKRGEISSDVYLAESGALDRALQNSGIDPESLREVAATKRSERFTQSWADATTQFLQGAGKDWPGGSENLEIAGRLIAENGLTDQPSAETLATVWQHMKENGLAVDNPETRVASSNSVEEIKQLFGRQSSSSMFGR